ncbi:MAG: ribulose-phosphate 3-epimerase [bacterium]
MTPVRIAPSLLSADQTNLRGAIDDAVAGGIDLLHLDVMDAHFVPNLTFGPKTALDITRYIRERGYTVELDIHLMVTDPDHLIPEFAKSEPRYLTVHVEAPIHLHRTLDLIRRHKVEPGVSLNPATALATLEEVAREAALVLLMSVNPGYSGQSFIEGSIDKIRRCRELLRGCDSAAVIEVDGGIGPRNIATVVEAGARVVVAGNAVFDTSRGTSVETNIAAMREALGGVSV